MLRTVADVIDGRRSIAVVQASTGTGKSLAALIPVVLSGRRAVVLTATKALQDQLATKDLPELAAKLRPFTWQVLKGRSAYACAMKLAEMSGAGQLINTAELDGALTPGVRSIMQWADEPGCDGDLDRAPVQFTSEDRAAVTIAQDECSGRKCAFAGSCFGLQARRQADEATVIVTNMALYASHLASGKMVLPDHDLLVIDETHRLEDVLAEGLGVDVPATRVTKYARKAAALLATTPEPVGDDLAYNALTAHRDLAIAMMKAAEQFGAALERIAAADGTPLLGLPLPDDLADVLAMLTDQAAQVNAAIEHWHGEEDIDTGETFFESTVAARIHTLGTKLVDALVDIEPAGAAGALYVEKNGPALKAVNLNVGEVLASMVWGQTPTIMCSATVPPNMTERLRIDASVERVASPFDLANNAILYNARHLGDPRQIGWQAGAYDEMERLIRAAGGRTLALFSSRRAMQDAANEMHYRGLPFPIITQDIGKNAAIAQFADDEQCCLFGTQGLYEGIDVPGRSLSLVIIDKIPFPHIYDPLTQARQRQHERDGFWKISVPHAATLLTQAAGRLIRSVDDRGVVAILDGRIGEKWKAYGRTMVDGLRPMRMTSNLDEVCDFLEQITTGGAGERDALLEAVGF